MSRLEEKGNITSNENNEDPKQKTDSKNSNEVSPKNVKHIHLNSHDGNDQNDGLTEESSVKTFAKAKSLIQDGDIILLMKHGLCQNFQILNCKETQVEI